MYRDDAAALAARRDALARELEETERMLDEVRGIRRLPVLPNTRRAARCNARWDDMPGDDRVRSCDACKQNVYNFTAMTREQAESLILEREGQLCGRYYQRADGSILLGDCWIGAQRWRRIKTVAAATAATLGGALVAGGFITELTAIQDREDAQREAELQIGIEYHGTHCWGRPLDDEPPPEPNVDVTRSDDGEWMVTDEYGRTWWRPSADPRRAQEALDAWLEPWEPRDAGNAWDARYASREPIEMRPPTITDPLPKPTAVEALFTRIHRRR